MKNNKNTQNILISGGLFTICLGCLISAIDAALPTKKTSNPAPTTKGGK